jgi:cation:H+ antiporter
LAVLALIAVLPEYAVDFVFAWKGGHAVAQYGASCPSGEPGLASPCSLALANMTGANRLLIGIGWSSVVFIAWYRSRKRVAGREPAPIREISLARTHAVEIAFLGVATLYSLTLPLKHSITLFDAGVLIGLFLLYMLRLARAPAEEPHLVGPARGLGSFPERRRRVTVVALFIWAAFVIVLSPSHSRTRSCLRGATTASRSSSWCSGSRRLPRRRRSSSSRGCSRGGCRPTPRSAHW